MLFLECEHQPQTILYFSQLRSSEPSCLLCQHGFIERKNLRHVNGRFPSEPRSAFAEGNVSRSGSQACVRGDGSNYDGSNLTSIEIVRLNDNNRTTISRFRPTRYRQIRPPDLPEIHYQSSFGSA